MTVSSRAPMYDLFKLIVAIILLLIFLLLWLGIKSEQAPQAEPAIAATITLLPATETPLPTPTVVPASATALPPTQIPSPTNTPTLVETSTSTPLPPPSTETPIPTEESLPPPIVEIPADTNVCEANSHSQLKVGQQATINRKVNLRSSPGLFNNWITVNQPGTQVEVIGGPACTRYQNGGAYLWWQIKLPNGRVGWSAEASAFGSYFFMEPVK